MLRKIIFPLRLIEIILILLGYFLGGAIGQYLGFSIKYPIFWNGLILVYCLYFGSKFISRYLQLNSSALKSFSSAGGYSQKDFQENRNIGYVSLLAGITFLAIGIIPASSLFAGHYFNKVTVILFAMIIFFEGVNDFFPAQITEWGMTEFTKAFLFANCIPAIGFAFQGHTIHRLVYLLTFPLFFITFALFIVLSMPALQTSTIASRHSILPWAAPITLLRINNFLLLAGYLLLLMTTLFDVPWRLIWPSLMAFPICLVEIWQINQILAGHKPNIQVLELTATAVVIFTTYFMILAIWLN
jgi:hypothetical protein